MVFVPFLSDIGPYGSKFSIDDVKKSMQQTGVGLKGEISPYQSLLSLQIIISCSF